ncbi:HEAT repeat domain-containing protein [Caryophanon tenue]|uniref:HEAT repeat domain-containing protein n=1 Tax=Caryophanon tenue TaxID=33978 RepID=A0A1C0Y6P6_9BACL|nr:HEAT repeat domain-containing protein [Caryophanon tenue]OCS82828.1 hypothetical protein A6M13_05360 [Caryophanon tenue]
MSVSITVLVNIIGLLVFLLVLLMGYVLYKRSQQNRVLAEKEAYMAQYEQQWYNYLVLNEPFDKALVPKEKGEFVAVEEILLAYVDHVSNTYIHEKITYFAKKYLYNYYGKMMTVRKWSYRMNAIVRIVDFQIDTLLPKCVDYYEKNPTQEERYILLQAIALFDPHYFTERLFTNNEVTFSEFEYRRIFTMIEPTLLLEIAERYEELPQKIKQYALIDTLGVVKDFAYMPILERALTSHDIELRIRALKGLNNFNWVSDVSIYIPFSRSAIWEERLMLAKILRYVPLSHSKSLLRVLIQDRNWWVRKQAAETIALQKGGGAFLEDLALHSEDAFTKDIAQEMLAKVMT